MSAGHISEGIGALDAAVTALEPKAASLAGQLTLATDMDAVADLPPMWVPLTFAGVLLVGVALLQLDLGDVFGDEAMLENSIGDKSKSTREARDRSYFSGSGGEL